MNEQKQFIKRFRKDDFGLDAEGRASGISEHLRSSFEQALNIISKDLYSDDLHFLYELIQNAQDNTYRDEVTPNLRFILLKDDPTNSEAAEGCLCVINNEVGFSEADIKSICSTGQSTKKLKKVEGYIGEKGIGFKSVFKVSKFPHVFSNGYNFRLLGEDKLTGLSYIVPYWLEDIPRIVRDNLKSTCILLPLQKGKYQDIEAALKNHKPEVTLFLDKLRRLEIQIPSEDYKAVFEETIEGDILSLSSIIDKKAPARQTFYISSKKVRVPDKIKEEKREGVKERTISIAFPLQKYRSLSVFAYLPTEMLSGLPFIINADFLLAANRESINTAEWNNWLLDELAGFVADEIVRLAKENTIGSSVYGFIPISPANDEHRGRLMSMAKDVVSLLKPSAFVKNTDGELYPGHSVRLVYKEFRELFSSANHQVQWLSEDLIRYVDHLKRVGVHTLSKEEEEAYYYQSEYVELKGDAWFIRYYQYLWQLKNRSPDSYPILPLDNGGMATVQSSSTYLPIESEFGNEIAGHFFPGIQTLRRSLFSVIDGRDDSEKIFANLGLKTFSLANYFFEIVLPEVAERAESATIHDGEVLIEFVLNYWDQLDIDDNLWQSDHGLPVLLDGGRVALSAQLEKRLVYPAGYFPDGGWELIFLTDDEKIDFCILDSWYTKIQENDPLKDYFSAIEVCKYPDPPVHEQNGPFNLGTINNVYYKEYAKRLNNCFFHNSSEFQSSYQKTAKLPYLPSVFEDLESISDETYDALICYLNYIFSLEFGGSAINASLCWYYRSSRTKSIGSPIGYYLEHFPWVKTQKGFHRPSECFFDDPNLRRIFGEDLPYVSTTASPELLDKFGVRRDAETDTIIGLLRQLSGSTSTSKAITAGLYNALKERSDFEKTSFSENSLIFIPETEGKPSQWCTSAEVIWDDITDITNDSIFESLEPHYSDGLKDFFVNKLNVKESIDANIYADLWLNLQTKPSLNNRDLNLYNKAFQNVRLAVRQKERPEWLSEFQESARLYSDSHRWVSPDDEISSFLPDLAPLRDQFSGKASFIMRIDDHSYEWMQPLVQFLNFECFSEVVKEELITAKVSSLVAANKYLSDFSVKLLIRLLANKVSEGREIVEKFKSSGELSALLHFRETEVDQIKIKLYVPHTAIITITSNHSVFLDFDQKLLYVKKGVDSEEVKDELERLIINRVLQKIASRQERETFEDSISKILGVVSEERYKKLLSRKPDWHIPRDILTFVDRIIKDRSPHELALKFEKVKRDVESVSNSNSNSNSNSVQELAKVLQPAVSGQSLRQSGSENPKNIPSSDDDFDSASLKDDGLENDILRDAGASNGDGSLRPLTTGGAYRHLNPDSKFEGGNTSGVRVKSTRSNNVASQVNQARRSKLRSYVVSDLVDVASDEDAKQSEEKNEYRRKLGEKAELIVEEDLKAKGFDVLRMPPGNSGYDIHATNPLTGELLFFEVKGDSYAWSDKGVGISKPQYHKGLKEGASFYLAVVDNLASVPSSPYYIRDPISYITEYRFDSGWSALAVSMKAVQSKSSDRSVLEQMITYTDDPNCQELLRYCNEMGYPFPDAGAELQGENGSVVVDNIELLWENERIIVFVEPVDLAKVEDFQGDWKIFLGTEQARTRKALDLVFGEEN